MKPSGDFNQLSQKAAQASKRAASLGKRLKQEQHGSQTMALEMLAELQTALEELNVANEELSQQNEQLIASRRQLELERERYLDLFDFAPDAYLVTTEDGSIFEANQAAAAMLNVSQRFLIRKPLAVYIAEQCKQQYRDEINTFKQANVEAVRKIEMVIQPRNANPVEVSITVARFKRFNHPKATLRWIMRDITERKRKEELLAREQKARSVAEKANQSKDDFLATFSHELRTPLNAILGWTHILRRHTGGNEVATNALDVIERNATTQAQLINDILDVSRIIYGNIGLEKHPIRLGQIVESALDSVRPLAEEKGIEIHSEIDANAGLIEGDSTRLQQVVWNLLSNAIKFTPGGGRVEIKAERDGLNAVIKISDTGRGISPEFLPRVFDRFTQADQSSARKQGGLGVGLAIVKHIVEMHGGSVEALSDGIDRGSTFIIKLPLLQTAPVAEDIQMPATDIDGFNLDGISVLVVDDEADARELLRLVLEQWGSRVAVASTCAEALSYIKDESLRPDIMLADIAMPGEDGFDLIRQVRQLDSEEGAGVKAIALTAYAAYEDRIRMMEAGFDAHLAKPVSLKDLGIMLARFGNSKTE